MYKKIKNRTVPAALILLFVFAFIFPFSFSFSGEDASAETETYVESSTMQTEEYTEEYTESSTEETENKAWVDYDNKTDGYCGSYVSWHYSDGSLVINGTGDMYDFDSNYVPWENLSDKITSLYVNSGVTYIGANTFYNMPGLTDIAIPASVKSIGENAFKSGSNLTIHTTKDSYAKIYAEYMGFGCLYDNEDESESYEVLTDNTEEIDGTVVGGIDDGELNTASEVETDYKGNIIIVPYAGAADGSALPGAGVIANDVNVYEIAEDMSDTTETGTETSETTQTTVQTDSKGEKIEGRITWNISDGVLFLSGSGDMDDYQSVSKVPWFSRRKEIVTVEISENITSIGNYAFAQCDNLVNVDMPTTVYSIGKYAFYNCKNLQSISIPSSVLKMEEYSVGYLFNQKEKNEIVDTEYIIYGETGSEAQNYAIKNGISFTEKIQKNDLIIPEEEAARRNVSFRYKLIIVTSIAVAAAFIIGIVFYIWQRKGGLIKLVEKNKSGEPYVNKE